MQRQKGCIIQANDIEKKRGKQSTTKNKTATVDLPGKKPNTFSGIDQTYDSLMELCS